ncbi:Planctomycete cytochrome C [Rosistilla carotiformis]|uniref:Planctomycete cytochrome C n=1 Tax=Rosistilla carotiformis TaxID=2528017 RepID=A0A518JW85_9BACT|nr:PSD1 and planctomycete cytochrome C domain-containing protein [Rosistilla carotiformis]QDV69799.1 Planctomycete cytochrome C [Rosistilla carotiformis]
MNRLLACSLFVLLTEPLVAEDPIDFVEQVRPIFQTHCYACHAEAKQKSGFRLDIKSAAFDGGDGYGAAIVPGEIDESPLIELITSDDADTRMPPEGSGLSPAEIDLLRRWVQQGAAWPEGVDLASLEDRTDHWSFKPLAFPIDAAVSDSQTAADGQVDAANDLRIDAFVQNELQRHGLAFSPAAPRRDWLRRVSFDLIGLPPTPQQIAEFEQDDSSEAFGRVVDRLLASPRYGERWGQHWLDVVRYADTHGFEVNTPRPNAWPYRDYVIAAFNNDTPYDQFIHEQLHGDTLQQDAATGFLVTAAALLPGQIGKDDASKRLARQDELAEIVINTGEAFLGLSVGCARCHDHKFDAISHTDYFAMQAFFSGVKYGERPIASDDSDRRRRQAAKLAARVDEIENELQQAADIAMPTATDPQMNSLEFEPIDARFVRFTIHDCNRHPSLGLIEPCLDEFEIFAADPVETNVALASRGTKLTASGSRTSDKHRLEHLNDGLYGNSHSWMSDTAGRGWVLLELPETTSIQRVVWSRDRQGKFSDRLPTAFTLQAGPSLDAMQHLAGLTEAQVQRSQSLRDEKQSLEKQIEQLNKTPQVFAGRFTKPEPTYFLLRGDPEQPREVVPPAVLAALGDVRLPDDAPDRERRVALADWIVRPDNPLTARVMVNRIWQWHFGTGLVGTPSDFGRSGERPSHPELLDWLAAEFIRSGWSVKHLHRLIVLSQTYGQSNQIVPAGQAVDASVRLLWRFPSRRMEAEAIRDSMLAVNGRLNLTTGGPGFDLFKSRGGLSGFPPIESFSDQGLRRMVYAHKIRMEPEAVFGAFDCPDAGQSAARRRQSTTPIQALNLFNSRFTIEQSEALAARAAADVGQEVRDQIQYVYRLALARDPERDELDSAEALVGEHGLPTLCRVIYNTNEFLFMP